MNQVAVKKFGHRVSPKKSPKAAGRGVGKPTKRKRASLDGNVLYTDRETLLAECSREISSLFDYYKELSDQKLNLKEGVGSSNNSLVVSLLKESNLSYSKLVEAIYEKLKGKEGITLAIVRSAVLRSMPEDVPAGDLFVGICDIRLEIYRK